MTNSTKLFELAQLAEASYAEFEKFSGDAIYSATEVRDALASVGCANFNLRTIQ